jgi:hypothetical protein
MPRRRLASPEVGICAEGLVEARVWGLITQQRYRSVADPAPPPALDTRCAPSFPRKRWRDNKGGLWGVDKTGARFSLSLTLKSINSREFLSFSGSKK